MMDYYLDLTPDIMYTNKVKLVAGYPLLLDERSD